MQTTNSDIKSLVDHLVYSIQDAFKDSCQSIYIMGSLARGNFSEATSDIDVGIIIRGSLTGVDEKVNQILSDTKNTHPNVKNSVSIFWGSIQSINGQFNEGRYPAFDRLDLIEHALLLCGQDVKDQLIRPTKKELDVATASFCVDYLCSEERLEEFRHCERMVEKGTLYVTKTILFPARFIYLENTGKVAGNDDSYRYYMEKFSGPDAVLMENGYRWRFNSLPENSNLVTDLLNKGLTKLYVNFIDIYINSMGNYGELKLKKALEQWKQSLIDI